MNITLTPDEAELVHQAISDRVDTLSKIHANLLKKKLHDTASGVLDRAVSLNAVKENIRAVFNLAK